MKRTRAVLVAPKQFDFVQEEIPKLKENEVLYKTISVGLCHSDIPAYRGTSAMGFGNKHGYDAMIKNPQFPMGIGHEPVCVVEDVGSAVTCFRPGDLVTGVLSTCIADYNVAANAQMIKIPETSKPIDACLGEPMMCVANIVRAVEPKMGDRVAVIGCGFMGLMVIAGLKSRALGDIVAIDLDEKRLEMAVQYGATKTISQMRCWLLPNGRILPRCGGEFSALLWNPPARWCSVGFFAAPRTRPQSGCKAVHSGNTRLTARCRRSAC